MNIFDIDEDNEIGTNSTVQSFIIPNEEQHQTAQRILAALDHSPIKSQTRTSLLEQIPEAIRRWTAKLRKLVAAATTTVASSLAPNEMDLLVDVSVSINRCQ